MSVRRVGAATFIEMSSVGSEKRVKPSIPARGRHFAARNVAAIQSCKMTPRRPYFVSISIDQHPCLAGSEAVVPGPRDGLLPGAREMCRTGGLFAFDAAGQRT